VNSTGRRWRVRCSWNARHSTIPAAIERLVGLQAQLASAPYVGLWTRLRDFRREDLANQIENRRVVNATLMRVTLHLFTAGEKINMPNWHHFIPSDFEYDFEQDKLSAHGVTFDEAVECFFSDFQIRRNKRYRDRYQLLGRTLGGRTLKIIFQLKPKNVVRIITGWDI